MYNKRTVGAEGEQKAIAYLQERGYTLLEHNFYCRNGEIDIIAKDEGYLVFLEVKYRTNVKNGYPEEAVGKRKQKSIIDCARYYLYKNHYREETPCRFDVVVILQNTIRLYKNAFESY